MANKNSSGFANWKYLSELYFFPNGYLFFIFSFITNSAIQYRSNLKWRRLILFGPLCQFLRVFFKKILYRR